MESKPSPDHHRAEDAAWSISAGTRQGAREADACIASDEWLYAPATPIPRAERRATSAASPAWTPAR